jgi:hypothetical protein
MANTLSKLAGVSAVEIGARIQLSETANTLLHKQHTPERYLRVLIEQRCFTDAVGFLSHALPKREAVWWACYCARHAGLETSTPEIEQALTVAERWVLEPNEPHRRAALAVAEAAQLSTPAGCAAIAAFLSGGSLAPLDAPPVPPGEHLTARAVTGSVLLAAVGGAPDRAADKFLAFLSWGLEIAAGQCGWE